MPTPLSPICQKIQNQLNSLKQEQKSLQDELKEASPGQKSGIASQIKALAPKIAAKTKELQECIKKNPYVPPPEPKANPCLPLAKEVAKLQSALNKEIHEAVKDLQADLHSASPGQKPAIVAEIKAITADIKKNSATGKKLAAKKKEYNKCIIDNGGQVALSATFTGTATLKTSNSNAKGPFNKNVNIGLFFSVWDRKDISITSFPKISVTYDTPIGKVTTTVTMNSGSGTFNSAQNRISLDLVLAFHHSTNLAGDSTLTIALNTDSPLTAAGNITVSGSSKFKGGYLDGDTCWLTVKGKISPHP
jgi:gas vesicle protein